MIKFRYLLPLLAFLIYGTACSVSNYESGVMASNDVEKKVVLSEQAERKRRSESILKTENIPFIDHLPAIQSSAEVRVQSESDVVLRALCLTVVAVKGEGIEQETIDQFVSHYGLNEHFTPDELAFIEQKNSSAEDKLKFIWRYESAWVMLWALGFVETLDRPDAIDWWIF